VREWCNPVKNAADANIKKRGTRAAYRYLGIK
jgi:hypothetical protein